jgi:hypothetical protein
MSKETPYGTIRVEWKQEQNQMVMHASIPVGSTARFILPEDVQTCLIDDEKVKPVEGGIIWMENGKYTIKYSQ